jgi:hypothetical protein
MTVEGFHRLCHYFGQPALSKWHGLQDYVFKPFGKLRIKGFKDCTFTGQSRKDLRVPTGYMEWRYPWNLIGIENLAS